MANSGHRRQASYSTSPAQVVCGIPSDAAGLDYVLNDSEGTQIPDFYQQLHGMALGESLTLTIPETLIVSRDGRDILLFSDDDNHIQIIDSEDVLNRFFHLCEPKLHRDIDLSEFPLFIFSTDSSSYKVLFSVPDAEKQWRTSKNHMKLLQRYLIPSIRQPMKTRIVWTPIRARRFNIKKRGIESLFQEVKKAVKPDSFSHAVKVQKSPFSLNLPHQSRLGANRRGSEASPIAETVVEPYFVSSRQEGDYTFEEVNFPIPQAEDFVSTLIQVLRRNLANEDYIFTEISYDVIQELNGKLHFLNIKWVKSGPVVEESKQHILSDSEIKYKNLRRRFTDLLSTEKSPTTPFIDLHEIQEQNVRLYLHQLDSQPLPKVCPMTPVATANRCADIEQAGHNLDTLVQAAVSNKIKQEEIERVKLESYPKENFLDFIIGKVYSKVTCDPDIKEYFANLDRRAINVVKFGFCKAFKGVDNYYFKRTIKRAHQGLGISQALFDRFVEVFLTCMLEEGVRNEDVEIVHRHLKQFRDEVVEEERDSE